MIGLNAETGAPIEGLSHLRQSVRDILTTPIGSRVMRRDYGSDLFQLIDRPVTSELALDIYAAVIAALWRWEPRLEVTRVSIAPVVEPGRIAIDIDGLYKPDGRPVRLEGIIVQ